MKTTLSKIALIIIGVISLSAHAANNVSGNIVILGGDNNKGTALDSSLIAGSNNTIKSDIDIFGDNNNVDGGYGSIVGDWNVITGKDNKNNSINNMGSNNVVNGNYNDNLGSFSSLTGDNNVVLGSSAKVNASNSITLGKGSINTRDNTVSFGSEGGERQLTNVATGTTDTDGANVKQMRDSDAATLNSANAFTTAREQVINSRVDSLLETEKSDRITGDADTLAKSVNYTDKQTAAAISTANSYTDTREQATNSRTDGLVANEKSERVAGDALTLSRANSYTDTREQAINNRTDSLMNTEQSARIEGDKRTLQSANTYTNNKFSQLNDRVNRNERRANAGISGAMAMTSIPYLNYVDNSVGMGSGTYRGETSIAAGYQRQINAMTNFRISTSWDTSNGVGLAAGMALGW